jgi:NADPH:quinone reductase-like Zn-dependent oxidoreductase
MKAIRFDHYGEPKDVLTVAEQPVPQPSAGQVRVKNRLSPINPSDLLYVRGHYSGVTPHFPSGAGFEGVATIDAIGPDVDGLSIGQRVFAQNYEGGNWAQYAVVPADTAYPVPDDIDDEQIASLMINPASAILMVRHVLAVPRGEWLLQSAAGGELGRMIIRLAKHDGFRTINVVRRREAAQELKDLGADEVIVSTEGPIDEQVHKIVGPQGVGFAIDPAAGQTGTEIFRSLSEDGHMLVYGSLTGQGINVGDDPRLTLSGRRILEVYWLGYWLLRLDKSGFFAPDRPAIPQLIDEIVELIRAGILHTTPGKKFSLDDIVGAVTESESVGHSGKINLAPNADGHAT